MIGMSGQPREKNDKCHAKNVLPYLNTRKSKFVRLSSQLSWE